MNNRLFSLAVIIVAVVSIQIVFAKKKSVPSVDVFPDGTEIPQWFHDTTHVDVSSLGKQYVVTDYGVMMDDCIYTKEIQNLIDIVASNGGGVIVIPSGIFNSGALFFRQGTHLHLQRGAVLRGSTRISDFPIMMTRMEGQSVMYYPALVNADGLDGFTITGEGTLDGNGLPYWKAFWQRRTWNPSCTNKDEQRPRVLYISNCRNVQIERINMQNSPFWTSHYYRSENIKLLDLQITSLYKPVEAPSTDAIDIDACRNVLVRNCSFSVDDDAIALKGGKGPWADDSHKFPDNGGNENIIIEDCQFGFCHSCLTCGSESIYDHNILFRNCRLNGSAALIHLKMRTDTPQDYQYVTVENITGTAGSFLQILPWDQFADLQGRTTPPISYSSNITMRNITMECGTFFNVAKPDPTKFVLKDFTFENLDIKAKNPDIHPEYFNGLRMKNVVVNSETVQDR